MFERYTERARRTLFFARYESSQVGSMSIEPEHLLLGLLRERRGAASSFLQRLPADLHQEITSRLAKGAKVSTSVEIPFSAAAKRALQTAAEEADRLKHAYIGTEHLLLGLLADPSTIACEMLNGGGLTLEGVRKEIAERPSAAVLDGESRDNGEEMVSHAFGAAATRGVDRLITVIRRFREHPKLTDNGRQLVDRICTDLEALKSEIGDEPQA